MKKIKTDELISVLAEVLKRKPKAKEIVEALGMSSEQIYYNRIQRNGCFSETEILKLEKYYNIDLSNLPSNVRPDAVEIKYLEIPELEEVIKNPLITSIWLDKELVRKVWCRKEDDLKILQMPGNSMDGGFTPIKSNDTLIIDTSVQNINFAGIFAYTTNRNRALFVNSIELKADTTVRFSYFNPDRKEELYDCDMLKKMNFRLLGQVIKNLSLGL